MKYQDNLQNIRPFEVQWINCFVIMIKNINFYAEFDERGYRNKTLKH